MSDDGYYYDDEFDEFNEMLYDADASPDLADDLAEHAMHSPLWQENPTEELRDYHSDWEYYSDDYFDDDPDLLNGVTKTGDGQRLGQNPVQPAKRGKKRKLSETREHPKLEKKEFEALTACLRGTVWKSQSPETGVTYRQGVDSPVALHLSEEIMQNAYSRKRGFGKGRVKHDESWANDLSLADMGLKAERTMSVHEQPKGDEEEEDADIDGDAIDQEEETGDDNDSMDEEAVDAGTLVAEPYRVDIQPEPTPLDSAAVQAEMDHGRTTRKRRKLSAQAQPAKVQNTLPTPDGSLDRDQSEAAVEEDTIKTENPTKRGRGRPKKSETVGNAVPEEGEKETKAQPGPGRKRKLSVNSATASTASSRAKRLDIKKDSTDSKSTVFTAAATRPTRNRKK